jgi:hypothetical protein
MQNQLLIWAAVMVPMLAAVAVFFSVQRARRRAKWRSKRPIHVKVVPPSRG